MKWTPHYNHHSIFCIATDVILIYYYVCNIGDVSGSAFSLSSNDTLPCPRASIEK